MSFVPSEPQPWPLEINYILHKWICRIMNKLKLLKTKWVKIWKIPWETLTLIIFYKERKTTKLENKIISFQNICCGVVLVLWWWCDMMIHGGSPVSALPSGGDQLPAHLSLSSAPRMTPQPQPGHLLSLPPASTEIRANAPPHPLSSLWTTYKEQFGGSLEFYNLLQKVFRESDIIY